MSKWTNMMSARLFIESEKLGQADDEFQSNWSPG